MGGRAGASRGRRGGVAAPPARCASRRNRHQHTRALASERRRAAGWGVRDRSHSHTVRLSKVGQPPASGGPRATCCWGGGGRGAGSGYWRRRRRRRVRLRRRQAAFPCCPPLYVARGVTRVARWQRPQWRANGAGGGPGGFGKRRPPPGARAHNRRTLSADTGRLAVAIQAAAGWLTAVMLPPSPLCLPARQRQAALPAHPGP